MPKHVIRVINSHFIVTRLDCIKNSDQCYKKCAGMGTLITSYWKCKIVQIWRIILQYLGMGKIHIPYDITVPQLGMRTHTRIFTVTLFLIAKYWRNWMSINRIKGKVWHTQWGNTAVKNVLSLYINWTIWICLYSFIFDL